MQKIFVKEKVTVTGTNFNLLSENLENKSVERRIESRGCVYFARYFFTYM